MEPSHNRQELHLVTVTVCLVLVLAAPVLAEPATSEWVYADSNEKLAYKSTPAGDRIMDFSYADFRGGGVAIPSVFIKRTVEPSGSDDDTTLIQAAIDEVAQLPLAGGFRGAVLLGAGTFAAPRPELPEGTLDSHGTPVAPQSLYLAQLAERLGPEAVKNIGYLPGELP